GPLDVGQALPGLRADRPGPPRRVRRGEVVAVVAVGAGNALLLGDGGVALRDVGAKGLRWTLEDGTSAEPAGEVRCEDPEFMVDAPGDGAVRAPPEASVAAADVALGGVRQWNDA